MEPPPWDRKVSFKHALAVTAVQQRKHAAEVNRWQERVGALEAKLQQAEAETAKAKAILSLNDLLETQSTPSLGDQVDSLAVAATLWTHSAELLPPDAHAFLSQVLSYSSRRTTSTPGSYAFSGTASEEGHAAFAAAATVVPTPAAALIQAMLDTVFLHPSSSTARLETILARAAGFLADLCCHPAECLAADDFSAIQGFISDLLAVSCGVQDFQSSEMQPGSAGEVNSTERTMDHDAVPAPSGSDPAATQALAARVIEALQGSPGTGYVVLGCAAHGAEGLAQQLRTAVTGEEGAVHGHGGEQAMVRSLGQVFSVLQSCLRELPSWSAEMAPADDFLRGAAAAVWACNAACEVAAPAHPDTAKQSQRCAALLVSALQQISAVPGPGGAP